MKDDPLTPGRGGNAGPGGAIPEADEESGSETGDLVALVGTTTRVFADCLLPNGALVEAPAHLPFYPAAARDTMRCRPGLDAAAAILAMATLGRDVRTPLLRWLVDRAAGFDDDGLLHRSYHLHGPSSDDTPDLFGTALLLYAVCDGPAGPMSPVTERATRSLASSLAIRWDADLGSFRRQTQPTGALRAAELAAVAAALSAAGAALDIHEWTRVADLVQSAAAAATEQTFRHRCNAENLGPGEEPLFAIFSLGWPFDREGTGLQAARIAEQMMIGNTGEGSLHRSHEHAAATRNTVRPVELFWLAAALANGGAHDDARRYFHLGVATADHSGHFPERADQTELSPSPRPYLLAHLLFLIAAEATGQLQRVPRGGHSSHGRS